MHRKLTYQELEEQISILKNERDHFQQLLATYEKSDPLLLLQSMTKNMKDIIILSIDKQYRYLYFNDTHKEVMKSIYGIDIHLGMNLLECISIEKDRTKAKINYRKALAGNAHTKIEEYGEKPYFYYESFFNPIQNDKNEIIGATALAMNVTARVKAEKMLSESESYHKAMIANIGDVIGIISRDGIIKYKSSNIEKLFGWKPEELIGKDAFINVHPDDKEKTMSAFGSILKNDQASIIIEFRYRLKNNSYNWVELNAVNNIYNPTIEGVLINYHDISYRKDAENEVKKQEDEYRKTMNELLVGIVVHDKDTKIILSNPEASRILGLSADQLKGKTAIDPHWRFVYEDLSPIKLEDFPISRVLATKKPLIDYVLGIHRSDRDYITWAELNAMPLFADNGEIEKVIINFVDITDRKKTEFKLQESEQTFRALFEKGPIGVAYHKMIFNEAGDPINYLFLAANSSYQKLTGVNPTGKLATEAFPGIEKDPFDWIGTFGKVAKTGEEIRFQQHLEPVDRWYDCVGYQYKPNHFVAAFLEITEQKRAEIKLKENQILLKNQNEEYLTLNEELNERNNEYSILNDQYKQQNAELQIAKEKAEESDRLKTAFLQNISHEVRTPMNAICGFSELLKDNNLPVKKRDAFIKIIQNSSNQLLSIVTDILTLSTVETNQVQTDIEKTNVNNIMHELLSIFKSMAANRNNTIELKETLAESISNIITDKTKLTQILTNLLSNAIKFTNSGNIEFGCKLQKNELLFYVKDNGIGIDPHVQDKIFNRFVQANKNIQDNYGGTGLGLTISKGFVELLSGKIWVESVIGEGSTFYVTLPYIPDSSNKPEDSQKSSLTINKVLVAEDEMYNFLFLKEVLHKLGVEIIHAKNGKDAVDLCLTNPEVDLILMDLKMPVMDGLQAAKQIKATMPDKIIIAQTAYANDKDINLDDAPFNDYISKPIKAELLKKIIQQYC